MSKIIFIDMDDCIADFQGHPVFKNQDIVTDVSHMYEHEFFLSLKPMPGSLVAVRALIKMGYDIHILTQPVAESAHSYSEKAQWIGKWFPELVNKIHMTQDKGLFKGDYLVDDNAKKWRDKFEANGGTFIHFRYNRNDDQRNRDEWERIVTYFKFQKELTGES